MANAQPSPPAGLSKLGEYTVIRSLGEGTFGKVKRTHLVFDIGEGIHL